MTQTLTLTDFLLARIAEDEAIASRLAGTGYRQWHYVPYGDRRPGGVASPRLDGICAISEDWHGTGYVPVSEHVARHDPTRVLAECEAKRRIVNRLRQVAPNVRTLYLRNLALPYAEHPDYREEWRP